MVALNTDADSIFTTLLIRNLNPEVPIFVRANSREAEEKLYQTGANYVVSLSILGGQELASRVEKRLPSSLSITNEILIERLSISSKFYGTTLKDLKVRTLTGCTVVGFENDGVFSPLPPADTVVEKGSRCFRIGTEKDLDLFSKTFGGLFKKRN